MVEEKRKLVKLKEHDREHVKKEFRKKSNKKWQLDHGNLDLFRYFEARAIVKM